MAKLSERLFDYDPLSGTKTWFSTSDDGDTWNFRREQDVEAILDRNKASQAAGFDKRENTWHAAHIPTNIIYEWLTKHGVDLFNPGHQDGVAKLLNDPDYRYLRVNHFIL